MRSAKAPSDLSLTNHCMSIWAIVGLLVSKISWFLFALGFCFWRRDVGVDEVWVIIICFVCCGGALCICRVVVVYGNWAVRLIGALG